MTITDETIEDLLDAAFSQLAHDCDPDDPGSRSQRKALKKKFYRILKPRCLVIDYP